jgi:hypothetical protein
MTNKPSQAEVNEMLRRLEPKRWVSDAERERLPCVNVHDSGQPLLPQRGHEQLDRLLGKQIK